MLREGSREKTSISSKSRASSHGRRAAQEKKGDDARTGASGERGCLICAQGVDNCVVKGGTGKGEKKACLRESRGTNGGSCPNYVSKGEGETERGGEDVDGEEKTGDLWAQKRRLVRLREGDWGKGPFLKPDRLVEDGIENTRRARGRGKKINSVNQVSGLEYQGAAF